MLFCRKTSTAYFLVIVAKWPCLTKNCHLKMFNGRRASIQIAIPWEKCNKKARGSRLLSNTLVKYKKYHTYTRTDQRLRSFHYISVAQNSSSIWIYRYINLTNPLIRVKKNKFNKHKRYNSNPSAHQKLEMKNALHKEHEMLIAHITKSWNRNHWYLEWQ